MPDTKTDVKRLRSLMAKQKLSYLDVSLLLGVSVKTVESWLADPSAASYRRMPARHLRAMEAMLPQFVKEKGSKKP